MQPRQLNDDLANYATIRVPLTALLIGNGASRAVWDRFGYNSLFQEASQNNENRFSDRDIALFNFFGTTNFERVLYFLAVTTRINEFFGAENRDIIGSSGTIRNALIEAVNRVHVPWAYLSADILNELNQHFNLYSTVFSTNYDLLLYWAIMQNPGSFRDFFFDGGHFDLSNTEIWGGHGLTEVLYLHGGLHLCRTRSGDAIKRNAQEGQNLLQLFGFPQGEEDLIPLFVAEGTSPDKLTSIRSSDYLSFAYSKLSHSHANLDIFGSTLGHPDRHIVEAISRSEIDMIAFSMHPQFDQNIIGKKAELHQMFPNKEIIFYDAATHPLGQDHLRINPE